MSADKPMQNLSVLVLSVYIYRPTPELPKRHYGQLKRLIIATATPEDTPILIRNSVNRYGIKTFS